MTGTSKPDLVLEVRGAHRFYFSGDDSEVAALKDVSFGVAAGEFVAVIGHSGSGKSTLLNLLAGLDNPDGGSIWVGGRRISHRQRSEQSLQRGAAIGVLTQASGLVEHLTLEENVDLAAFLRHRARSSRRGRQLGLGTAGPETTGEVGTGQLLGGVGLEGRRRARPSTLSGGETARANLAVALAGAPTVLLADEPTAEISRSEEQDVLRLLSELRPPQGVTVVVTHSEAVARAADRVLELHAGMLA
ncbi:MAG: putative transport system ATP-binding protein [Acidimicrobiaceae bacterium]|nr:putative transport system ATP-binding protein [Acidimicrobiaceae bacterium]